MSAPIVTVCVHLRDAEQIKCVPPLPSGNHVIRFGDYPNGVDVFLDEKMIAGLIVKLTAAIPQFKAAA